MSKFESYLDHIITKDDDSNNELEFIVLQNKTFRTLTQLKEEETSHLAYIISKLSFGNSN